jgi:hypothetical protein
MRQTWRNLTFPHWPYDPRVVRPLVPPQLSLDLFGGAAWVGLVPFLITGLRPQGWPALPWISRFPETNVRTYVVDEQGRRGVWFFSLDAARFPAVLAARAAYGLPYFWARMRVRTDGQRVQYASRRRFLRGASDIVVENGDCLPAQSELELFLTARFRLYATLFGKLTVARVEHPRWPLHQARVAHCDQSLVIASGLPAPGGEPVVHYAPRVDVRVGPPERVK